MSDEKMQYNISNIRMLLDNHGIKLSKSMGQNFLIDANIPAKIVSHAKFDESCGVLEVGPGLGALTQELSKVSGHVTAVELDKRLISILRGIFNENENVSLIEGDILKQNIVDITGNTMSGLNHHVCANLPYNITTPVITKFIDADVFDSITIMIQKEVAQRICAKPGTSEYGAFTVYANYHTLPEILFDVSPECFLPRPKVTSSVVKMKKRADRRLDENYEIKLFKVVRAAFGHRRKTLVNALYSVFRESQSKESITKIVESCGFDAYIRGEVLSVNDFIKLSEHL